MIPIIEAVPEKNGYWEIYDDGRKIWHSEENWKNMDFKDYDNVTKKYGIGGGDWLNLQDGDNKVRIISPFEDYGSHYNKATKKSVICLGKEECELCKKGDKPRVQFLGWVIDRKDNSIKLLRVGFSIYKQIGDYAKSDDFGFTGTPPYDITIKKSGQGLDTDYSVLPARVDTELTEEEKKDMDEKINASPEEIIAKMKAKIKVDETSESEPSSQEGEEEIDVKDIPF